MGKLDGHLDEIIELHNAGLNDAEVANKLFEAHRLQVTSQSINYQLQQARKSGLLPNRGRKSEPALRSDSPTQGNFDLPEDATILPDGQSEKQETDSKTTETPTLAQNPQSEPNSELIAEDPEIVDDGPLSEKEKSELKDCLRVIENGTKAFVEMGRALLKIRENRLYRESHKTFEAFVDDTMSLARSRAYQLINHSKVFEDLSKILDKSQVHPRPQTEAHVAELAKLKSVEKQIDAWNKTLQSVGAGRNRITAKVVRDEVKKLLPVDESNKNKAAKVKPISISAIRLRLNSAIDTLKSGDHKKATLDLEQLAEDLSKGKKSKKKT